MLQPSPMGQSRQRRARSWQPLTHINRHKGLRVWGFFQGSSRKRSLHSGGVCVLPFSPLP